MRTKKRDFNQSAKHYLDKIYDIFDAQKISEIKDLARDLKNCWTFDKQVFICGNGGSAANAIHLANDLLYGIGACGPKPIIAGIRVEALASNSAIMTCLANDTGYENIFSKQLEVKGNEKDLLIVLSGSGNSPNIVSALKTAKDLGMHSYAIVAFSGGYCKDLADRTIHFKVNDMQIAEDTQLIVGHICMQWLNENKPNNIGKPTNE